MTVDAIKEMEIGQVVDYIEEYNRIQGRGSKEPEPEKSNRRKATQADWDAFLG